MTAVIFPNAEAEPAIVYGSEDGEPLAETYVHLMAIVAILSVLKQYLATAELSRSVELPGTVLADQFLYYAKGYPRLRVAPDVMVILNVAAGGRDNYKIWEEGEVPAVVFEITSKGTKDDDENFKRILYEQLEVQEYWQFDPRGEWIDGKLRGYRHDGERYTPILDSRSMVLKLRLQVEGELLAFYREDNGQKLLTPDELAESNAALSQSNTALSQSNTALSQSKELAEAEADRLREKLRALGIDPE
jgi:Putative restriction endonuclease